MTPLGFVRMAGLALAFCALSTSATAQQTSTSTSVYAPSVGQEGKDVVWVPTPQALVDKMLNMAEVTANDYVIDLGSGDGRLVITAAKRGARALGIEYNPDMVVLSQKNAEKEGVAGKAQFVKADIFESDFSQATVITMFLLPELNLKLRPKILSLKPGTRIVSNSFDMGDWKADETARMESNAGCTSSWCTALLWIVPAKIEGTHKTPYGELSLTQTYQVLSGTLSSGGKTVPVEGKVLGERVLLTADGRELRGKVSDNRLEIQ
jgi:SAM-dependent methyltransferase